jgi:hypothetical protein
VSNAPRRIWSTDEDGRWSDVEYVRADLFTALEDEIKALCAHRDSLEAGNKRLLGLLKEATHTMFTYSEYAAWFDRVEAVLKEGGRG